MAGRMFCFRNRSESLCQSGLRPASKPIEPATAFKVQQTSLKSVLRSRSSRVGVYWKTKSGTALGLGTTLILLSDPIPWFCVGSHPLDLCRIPSLGFVSDPILWFCVGSHPLVLCRILSFGFVSDPILWFCVGSHPLVLCRIPSFGFVSDPIRWFCGGSRRYSTQIENVLVLCLQCSICFFPSG